MQLGGVFVLLALLALWTFQVVSIPPSLRILFEEDEAIATAAIPPTEEEQFRRGLDRLPPPPQNHPPQVAALITRLGDLQAIPPMVVVAVKRDRETPQDQTPTAWSEAELAALRNYQENFRETWEAFLSEAAPNWEKFPDSAIFFRSRFPPLARPYEELFRYGFYDPQQPKSWTPRLEDQPDFYLRLFRQFTGIGTLRFGSLSGWGGSDVTAIAQFCEETIRKSDYFFPDQTASPEDILLSAPVPPTILTLRQGLKSDQAIFMRSAEYLESLPMGTPATVALTRLLGNRDDAGWLISHVEKPKTAQALALILRQGADQIGFLDQKTYLSGSAWRHWLNGDLMSGISPALKGTLKGIQEFEPASLKYQVALAFLRAAAAYRQTGPEGIRRIPDPARPGSFLNINTATKGFILSSAFQEKPGENYSFSFQEAPQP